MSFKIRNFQLTDVPIYLILQKFLYLEKEKIFPISLELCDSRKNKDNLLYLFSQKRITLSNVKTFFYIFRRTFNSCRENSSQFSTKNNQFSSKNKKCLHTKERKSINNEKLKNVFPQFQSEAFRRKWEIVSLKEEEKHIFPRVISTQISILIRISTKSLQRGKSPRHAYQPNLREERLILESR